MNPQRSNHESGVALIFALLGILIAGMLGGALVSLVTTEGRAALASRERTGAFYLAESGLQHAKAELSTETDSDGNGSGTVAGAPAAGSYAVTATDLGDDVYRLLASGAFGESDVILEETVEVVATSRFPGGAFSIVGDVQVSQIQFNSNTDLVIDGVDSPGMVLTQDTTYKDVGSKFGMGVKQGYIDESDVVGSVTNTFDPDDVELSIAYVPEDQLNLTITEEMFTDFRNEVQSVWLPSATSNTIPGSGSVTWGTDAAPVSYKLPADQKIKSGQTVTGNGTLLFDKTLVVESGGSLDWDGNVIVYSDDSSDAVLEIGGSLNVTGNIMVIGGRNRNIKFEEKSTGSVVVNGAMTLLTDYSNPATKIEFYVESDFTLIGLATLVAPKQQVEFKPGSDVYVSGSFQSGRLSDVKQATELKFTFEDEAEFYKDDDAILAGASALVDLGTDLGNRVLANFLTENDVVTRCWRELLSQ